MSGRPLRLLVVTMIATVLAVSLVVPASAAVVVKGDGAVWRPRRVQINRGGSVRWRAVFRAHTVKAWGGNWTYFKSIPQGTSTPARTFNNRGRFRFYCTIHGLVSGGTCTGMCGSVLVG